MEIRNVLLIGGTGFLGGHVAHRLSADGYNIVVPTRHAHRARNLLLLPTTSVVEADVHDPAALAGLMAGQDAVINLVGILHSRAGTPYGPDFAQAHVELPKKIVAAAAKAGVKRLLHVSALNADGNGPSAYLRSKADGEAAIRAAGDSLPWTIFQPSIVFGPGDSFLNMFAGLLLKLPILPLASPQARFQPVFVEDVVNAMVDSITRDEAFGQTYELCGPKVYTMRQLVEYVGAQIGCQRPIVELSDRLSYLQALVLEYAPGETLMSRDNYYSLKVDSVCSGCVLPFGSEPKSLEEVVPAYLAHHFPRARYSPFRTKAGR
ncbi:MAG: complex I NDUFA9 subunit family protein [Rhodocyclaceae bacterium]